MKRILDRTGIVIDKFCFTGLCVMVAYATLFGTADFSQWLSGVNVWSVTALLVVLCAVPGVLKHFKWIISCPFMWLILVFCVWNAVCLLVGIQNGNQQSSIIGDIKSLIYIVMFPVLLYLIRDKERIYILMKIAVVTALLLGIFTCVFLWNYTIDRTLFEPITNFCLNSNYINLTYISDTIPRILFVSAPYQLYGCAFSVYFLANETKYRWFYIVACAISLFSIIMTYTRALYLATAVVAVLAICLVMCSNKGDCRRMVRGVAFSVVGCFVVLVFFSIVVRTNYFGFALQRVFVSGETSLSQQEDLVSQDVEQLTVETVSEPITEQTTEVITESTTEQTMEAVTEPITEQTTEVITESVTERTEEIVTEQMTMPITDTVEQDGKTNYLNATIISDGIREQTQKQMLEILHNAPMTGTGLGTVLEGRSGAPEYSYLDIAIKTGWVGLLLYLMPVVLLVCLVAIDIVRNRKISISCIWLSALVGQMVYAIFQPYVYSGMSILLYCSTIAVYSFQRRHNDPIVPQE